MNDKEIIDLINNSLVEEFELNEEGLVPEATITDDLGLDSLDIVDMIIILEQTFKFKIRDKKAIRGIRTLGDIHNFVINKKKEMENKL